MCCPKLFSPTNTNHTKSKIIDPHHRIPCHPILSYPIHLLLLLLLNDLRSIRAKLPHSRHPRHDIHLDELLPAREMYLPCGFEAETTVQFEVERVAGFEVGKAVFVVALGNKD